MDVTDISYKCMNGIFRKIRNSDTSEMRKKLEGCKTEMLSQLKN